MYLMNTEKTYSISFIGLKNGEHTFEYQIDSDFFKNYDYDDFNRIEANISVLLNKKATLLEVNFLLKIRCICSYLLHLNCKTVI